jgi:cytochrome c oxidase subunit III
VALLRQDAWPSNGPAALGGDYQTMGPWGVPALNTAILLLSGVTITIAHHALKAGNRSQLILFLLATVLLGFTFLGFQVYEYIHAYSDLNLTAHHRHLRQHVLHADGFPRAARDASAPSC